MIMAALTLTAIVLASAKIAKVAPALEKKESKVEQPLPSEPASSTVLQQGRNNRTNPKPSPIEAEIITVRPTGFEPSSITRPKGQFILAIDNRSGWLDLSLELNREAGGKLQDVKMPKGKIGWRGLIDLPPGRYVLTEPNHPDWACHINISAN